MTNAADSKLRHARLYAAVMLIAVAACMPARVGHAAERIRIASQKTGTLSWELEVMRVEGLAAAAGIELQVTELAAPEAGKIALKGGSVDIIVSDWLWVSRERSLGGKLVFYPFSSALGGVMVRRTSGIAGISDLRSRKLAVAGGALDKSWLLLQALARRSGLDLRRDANLIYGAPSLLSFKAEQGEQDATLTFWNFAAGLEAKGFVRAIDIADVQKKLGAGGPVAILGYAFDGEWAVRNRGVVDRFLRTAAKAKDVLAASDAHWSRLAPRIGVSDPATLAVVRAHYEKGIPRRPVEQEEADARALYAVLAAAGGADLVGSARELDKGTFWRLTPTN